MKLIFTFVVLLMTLPSMAWAGFIDQPTVKLQALDKSTARTITFEAKVGNTIEYGSLYINVKACRKSEPLDKPESASFLQIWEVPINSDKSEWIFSGWMFASSPALSAMNHPVYDVWVLDCMGNDQQNEQAQSSISDEKVASQDTREQPKSEMSEKTIDDVIDNAAQNSDEDSIEDSEAENE